MPRAGCTGLLLGILAAPVSTGLGIAPALLHGGSRSGTELYEPMYHVTRTESGFAIPIMRFSAWTAIATSPC